MITEQVSNVIESGGVLDSAKFGIKAENMGMLFHILRNQLYSNPVLAIAREYACNAKDANVMSGRKDLPIRITLPTSLEPFYKTRDFGNGLTSDEIKDIFISYGASTKRNTNDAIGMLGLGCKSAFSLVDAFIVNSYQNGICHSWSLYIDETQRGEAALLSKSATTEPDGLEVVVPVQYSEVHKFRNAVIQFFEHFNPLPEFVNLSVYDKEALIAKRNVKAKFNGNNWKCYDQDYNSRLSFAIMGGIAYPIDAHSWSDAALTERLKLVLNRGSVLNFEIGELDFAASREALQFTEKTKKALITRLKEIEKAITKEIQDAFSSCKTLWEAKIIHSSLTNIGGHYYSFQSYADKIVFNGKTINDCRFKAPANCWFFQKTHGRSYGSAVKVRKFPESNIIASKTNVVIENDIHLVNGLMNRITPLIEDGKFAHVYLVDFSDKAKKDEWLSSTGFDGPTLKLSDCPKVSLEKYYPRDSSYKPFSKKTAFELDLVSLSRRCSKRSDHWTEAEEDFNYEEDDGVYLEIQSYEVKCSKGYFTRPSELNDLIYNMKKCGIAVPTIYGIKTSAIEEVKANKNMICFWVWVKEEIAKKASAEAQDFIDYNHFYVGLTGMTHYCSYLYEFTKGLNTDHPMAVFMKQWADLGKTDAKHSALVNLCNLYGVKIDAKPSHPNWKTDWQDFAKKYPIVFRLMSSCTDKDIRKELVHYVKLVDKG
jgi:hypothetical protein